MYRQKAAEAKQSAAKAKNPFIKRAFEEVAAGWRVLAEQMEWTDRQKSPLSARAASGHATAAPPSSVMKSRRFMSDMGFLLTPCSRLPAPSA
jgi:hypothetical protein